MCEEINKEIWHARNELYVVGTGRGNSDIYSILDAQSGEHIMTSHEPGLSRLAKFFRSLGGDYAKMAGLNYVVVEKESGKRVLRFFRKGRMIGTPPPFEFFDKDDVLIGKLKRSFSISGMKLRFETETKEKLFEFKIRQQKRFTLSAKYIPYEFLIDDSVFVSISHLRKPDKSYLKGKRVRLVRFNDSLEPDHILRLLFLAVAISVQRIVQHPHS